MIVIIYRGWLNNLAVPLSVYPLGSNNETMLLLSLPASYILFSYVLQFHFL